MAKRNHDLEQLKNFANEIAWLEAKLIQQREAREDANTTQRVFIIDLSLFFSCGFNFPSHTNVFLKFFVDVTLVKS